MAEAKGELHRLFEKLDAALTSGDRHDWSLDRQDFPDAGGTVQRRWFVAGGHIRTSESIADTPEDAVRGALTSLLARALRDGKHSEDSARSNRDEIARLQRIIESA